MARQSVRIASREIVVEQSPLHVHYLFCGAHDFALNQPADGQLSLRPSLGVRVLGWIFCVPGLPILIIGLLSIFGLLFRPTLENLLAVLLLLGLGFLISSIGVKLLGGPRCWFDSLSGEVTIRNSLRTRRRPLADIVAVQVINAGRFGSNEERFISYQLNLVFDDPTEPRLFVAFNSDHADMGKKAKQVADFLHVPLLVPTKFAAKTQVDSRQDSAAPTVGRSDATRNWATTDEPMPPFDLAAGALGGLKLGDSLEQAEFLGRPDPIEQTEDFGRVYLDYAGRGFQIGFEMGQFVELNCTIALHSADPSPKPGQGFSRPRLSGRIELTPETNVAQVQHCFGPPESEENYTRGRALTYRQGRFSMEFEFEKATERLLDWSVEALDD
jgi:hypothetical protein